MSVSKPRIASIAIFPNGKSYVDTMYIYKVIKTRGI